MADYIPGFDRGLLEDRFEFLQSRATAHLSAAEEERTADEETLHLGCAATLLRDAACVALLIDETDNARKYFKRAGQIFLDIGLVTGSTLVALADTRSAYSDLAAYRDVIQSMQQQRERAEASERYGGPRPMIEIAAGSLRQIFSLIQTEWLIPEINLNPTFRDDPFQRLALQRNGGHPVGDTGLSIDSYIKMADWLTTQKEAISSQLPDFITTGLVTVAAARAENIRAAMNDGYHWRMLLRPTELLDIDSVVLMFIALQSGADEKILRMSWLSDVPLGDWPLKAALQLQEEQELPPTRHFA